MRAIIPSSQVASSVQWSTPAPIGGWNARDALAEMSPLDSFQLDNWFPGTTTVDVRPGYIDNANITVGQNIVSLMGLAKNDGTYKRFAGSQGGIYDITAGGAIGSVSSAATSGAWESAQINVGGISYLWCCCGDGTNKSRLYNSNTSAWTVLDGASTPVLTGLTSENVTNVSLWKYRLILCERNTLRFWYGPLNSVGGVFTGFDLGAVFKRGGYLVATYNWTLDAGDGPDDRFVAVTSEGEVAVYAGTDPSNVNTFLLVGVYDLGKPLSKRCFLKLAGDVGLLTEQGFWPLSKAMLSSTVDRQVALTDKIQAAFNSYYRLYSTAFGWEAQLLSKGPALLVNIPLSSTLSYQFVMNLLTGSWCRFTGWSATCMLVLGGKLYFAMGNKVYEGWAGSIDGTSAITAISAGAYSYGPNKLRGKKIKMIRPLMQSTGALKVAALLNNNFAAALAMTPDVSLPSGSSLWDTAVFGSSTWGGIAAVSKAWQGVRHNPARAFSLQVAVQAKNITCSWAQTDFIGEPTELSLA